MEEQVLLLGPGTGEQCQKEMIAERGCGEQLIVGCDSDLVLWQEKLPLSGAKVLLNKFRAAKTRHVTHVDHQREVVAVFVDAGAPKVHVERENSGGGEMAAAAAAACLLFSALSLWIPPTSDLPISSCPPHFWASLVNTGCCPAPLLCF